MRWAIPQMRAQSTAEDHECTRKVYGGHSDSRNPPIPITNDNNPKHYNSKTNKLLSKSNFHTVVSERLDENGQQDRAHNKGNKGRGANQLQEPSFPAYSPDINMVIEK